MATRKYVVTGDQYHEIDRRMMELKRQLGQKKGSPVDPKLVADVLQELIEGKFKIINSYADEEVESDYEYPEGFRVLSPGNQCIIWERHFPHLNSTYVPNFADKLLPEGAEDWAVIPKPSKVASSYHEALAIMLRILSECKFHNSLESQLGAKHLRLTEKTEQALNRLEEKTPGDFLVLPFQFGLRHRGKSVRRAQVCFTEQEFGLGLYEIAALLVTHTDRISGPDQLYIDCAGCEYSPNADGQFDDCLYFGWSSALECLYLDCRWHGNVPRSFGSASGFLL